MVSGITGVAAQFYFYMIHNSIISSTSLLISLFFFSFFSTRSALKIDHTWVIDTSFIFKYSDGPINRRPSLSHLCKVNKIIKLFQLSISMT